MLMGEGNHGIMWKSVIYGKKVFCHIQASWSFITKGTDFFKISIKIVLLVRKGCMCYICDWTPVKSQYYQKFQLAALDDQTDWNNNVKKFVLLFVFVLKI